MSRDDDRLARAARALRQEHGLRQLDLVAGRSRHFIRRLEDGEIGRLRVDDVRGHFARLGATVRVSAWWNGGALDRLLDKRHAAVIEAFIGELQRSEWRAATEVTFSEWGERGSIDVLGAHDPTRSIIVGEAKSEWGPVKETIRVLDIKARLVPDLAKERFGFVPERVAVMLVFPEDRTARRIAQRYAATLTTAFPARNVAIKAWLRRSRWAPPRLLVLAKCPCARTSRASHRLRHPKMARLDVIR